MKVEGEVEADELKEINEELDRIILHNLTLMQDFVNVGRVMEDSMSRGFLQLAKTRMLMGKPSLSPAGYWYSKDAEENPIFTVGRKSKEMSGGGGGIAAEEVVLLTSPSPEEETKDLGRVRKSMAGFMASNSVTMAQESFTSVLKQLVPRVNLGLELHRGMTRYRYLLLQKQEMSKRIN